jgi:tRNA(Ile)-lysidine synthase
VAAAARLVDEVRRAWQSLPDGRRSLVVAVSGGPDSVALARAVIEARDRQAPSPVVLAHLNHQLRGAESDADEDFVAAFHASLVAAGAAALHVCRQRLDVQSLAAAEGTNVEALARRERYRFLAEVARAHEIHWVATGHTANDQAETVLHRLLRGTGLQGLRGIAFRRPLDPSVSVVRPLLQTTREEVLTALSEWGQPFRQDSSNDDLRLTRNRIRHELLPYLAQRYNPAVVAVLSRLAGQSDEALRVDENDFGNLLKESERPRAGAMLVFDADRLRAAPRRMVRGMFRLVWAREGWPVGRMGYEAWDRLAAVVFGEVQAVDLPARIHARRLGYVVQVAMRTDNDGISPDGEAK